MARKSIRVKKANPQTPAVPVDYTLESITGAVTVSTLSAALPLGDWQLPAGHYVPAKMPMVATHPRPAAETSTWERHKWAYPGLEYRIPIAVQGGAYPFYYEITTQPGGGQPDASIGQQVGTANYGVLTWTPTSNGGPYTITVRVYDQEYPATTPLDVTWSVTVTDSTTRFVFVDVNAVTSGTGAIDSPVKLFNDLYENGHNQKVAYLRAGTHYTWEPVNTGLNYNLRSTSTPMSLLNYPGEDATINLSRGFFKLKNSSVAHGLFVGGLTIRDTYVNPDGTQDSRMFDVDGGSGRRITLFENAFVNAYGRGEGDYDHLPGGSNQGILHIGTKNGGAYDQYLSIINNTMANSQVRSIGSLYGTQYGVFEGNTLVPPLGLSGGTSSWMFDHKVQNDFWSLRRNVATIPGINGQEIFEQSHGANAATKGPLRTEICYNVLRVEPLNNALTFSRASSSYADEHNFDWVYRNTIIGGLEANENGTPYTLTFEKNVYLSDTVLYPPDGTKLTMISIDDLSGLRTQQDDILDAEYKLKDGPGGNFRTLYLGTRGHEIA